MAGKLTIRRVGNLLPTACLVGVLLVVVLFVWLSTAGLPGCALRYLETEAARHGLQLQVKRIKLAPSSGLAIKAQGITLQYEQPELPAADLRIRKAQVEFSLTRLLSGSTIPLNLRINDGMLILPIDQDANHNIRLEDFETYITFPGKGRGIHGTVSANLQGIDIKGKLFVADPSALLSAETAPEDESGPGLGETLVQVRPYLLQFQQQIARQQWEDIAPPYLNFTIQHREQWSIETEASLPRYDFGRFLFRDATLRADFKNNELILHHLGFKTVNPDTKVTLKAGYDLNDRVLSFEARSSAPLVRILQDYLKEDAPELLSRIQPEDGSTPSIDLSGHANFAENYALNKLTLRGIIEHHGVRLGTTLINDVHLSFYVNDGNFNIDRLELTTAEGSIKAAASAANGVGSARLDISLPDETLLALARDFSGNTEIKLTEDVSFDANLELHLQASMTTAIFEAGKTRFEDLLPSLQSFTIQFNTPNASIRGADIVSPALTVKANGVNLSDNELSISEFNLGVLLGAADSEEYTVKAADLILNADFCNVCINNDWKQLSTGKADFQVSATEVQIKDTRVATLHATAGISDFSATLDNLADTLRTSAIASTISLAEFSHADTCIADLHADLAIPQGFDAAKGWKNMQNDARLEARIADITSRGGFCASPSELKLTCTGHGCANLDFRSIVAGQVFSLNSTAELADDGMLKVDAQDIKLPLASFVPLLGSEPVSAIRIPEMVDMKLSATIDTSTGQLTNSRYQFSIKNFVRVCENVHVHKGMEIPLDIDVKGDFLTLSDTTMHYDADVHLRHKRGEANLHISGDPLKYCDITGTNTIPVDIINALIDNADAHWIMRDFRCTPSRTRNIMNNIQATVRYEHGILVDAHCDAELYNLEYILGAICDKLDAKGEPTGQEYLRTDLGPNPYTLVKEGKCGVDVLVRYDYRDSDGAPMDDTLRIVLRNPDLLYDNKPWLKRQGFKTGALTSRIQGDAIVFNLDNYTISLHNLRGVAYPAYSIGMYYSPIQDWMSDIILRNPARIETKYCIFPLSRRCEVPMQGLIHAESATGAGFRFLGTTIPLKNFSGFINISDTDVYLDRMNAESWGGVLNGALRIDFSGEHTTLDGYFNAKNMDLKAIAAAYGAEFTPANCNGFIRFQASKPELEAVQAYGHVTLKDGDLMQMSLFRPVRALLSDMPGNLSKLQKSITMSEEEAPPSFVDKLIKMIFDTGSNAVDVVQDSAYKVPFANHFVRYGIDAASSDFDIRRGHLVTRNMRATGYNLDIALKLDLNLDDLTLQGNLWPQISSVPTTIIAPLTFLSDFLIDINLYGDVMNPQWEFGLSKKLIEDVQSLNPLQKDKEKTAK